MKITVFWDVTLCGLVEAYQYFIEALKLKTKPSSIRQAMPAACLTHSSILKMEAVQFSETSVNFYQIK
jgi:hypothetical protein